MKTVDDFKKVSYIFYISHLNKPYQGRLLQIAVALMKTQSKNELVLNALDHLLEIAGENLMRDYRKAFKDLIIEI